MRNVIITAHHPFLQDLENASICRNDSRTTNHTSVHVHVRWFLPSINCRDTCPFDFSFPGSKIIQAPAPLSTPLSLPQTTAWLTTCQTRESATLASGHLWGANLIPKDSIIKVSSELTLRHHTNYDKTV